MSASSILEFTNKSGLMSWTKLRKGSRCLKNMFREGAKMQGFLKLYKKLFVVHWYWSNSDTDGVEIIKITTSEEEAIKALGQAVEEKAEKYVDTSRFMQVNADRRSYELTSDNGFAKFYITEESISE